MRKIFLNIDLRKWLEGYVRRKRNVWKYRALMKRFKHINSGGPFTRDEMNER
jgi:hypothetical protein